MAIGNGKKKMFFFNWKTRNIVWFIKVIIPFLSIFLRDVYFIKVRSPDLITTDDGDEELNLKVKFIQDIEKWIFFWFF